MAIKFDISDPKNQRILATFLVPIVIFYAFFHFVIKPKVNVLNAKKAEVVTLRNRVNGVKKSLELPEKLLKEKETHQAQLYELEQLLPSKENVATETIEDENMPYRANKYRITIESGFHQFSRFMSYVMSLPRIMSLSELNLSINPTLERTQEVYEGLEDQPRTLRIECILTSYVFKGFNDGS